MKQTMLMTFPALAVALFAAALAFAPAAHAQDGGMPSEAQLQFPGAAQATLVDSPLPAPAAQTQAAQSPAQPQAMQNTGANAGDPCPAPRNALTNAPDDMAKVQEEIDRFTLCVQRAQLLERLNESALKNQSAGDLALGFNPAMGSMPMIPGLPTAQQNMGGMGMPALPASALAGADVTPRTPVQTAAQNIAAATAAQDAEIAEEAREEPRRGWTIREISGSGNNVQAKLVSPEGDEVRARNGMKLPGGAVTVVRITPSGVTVRDGGQTKSLEWARS